MAANSAPILVVEDESSIASFVALYLKNAGLRRAHRGDRRRGARGGGGGRPGAHRARPHAAGHRRHRGVPPHPGDLRRSHPHAHARDEDVDKIIGLEVGADDYMTKPFNPASSSRA